MTSSLGRRGDLIEYPLHLVERDFLGVAIVKLRRAFGGMVHLLRGAFIHAGRCSPVLRVQNPPAARAVLSSDALTGGDAVDRAR